jgi:hypothetical protein
MFGVLFAVVRHAGWWLEWQATAGPAGTRELTEVELQQCES